MTDTVNMNLLDPTEPKGTFKFFNFEIIRLL